MGKIVLTIEDSIDTGGNNMADHAPEYFTVKEVFQGEEIEAIYRVAKKPVANQEELDLEQAADPMARMGQGFCPAFNPRTYEAAPGIICHQDVEVVMRDGCKIYTDIIYYARIR
ncbi:MAG: hypothetical protein MJ092_04535, partial [Lachnospiraceae bacterium]|nr:hypothetical protein [Lachnospiraceae bacterium]